MFKVEMKFIRSGVGDVEALSGAFFPDGVVHEPASLPYPGEWEGLKGFGALFHKMREVWSDMRVESLTAAREGDTVLLARIFHLPCRTSGVAIEQPSAEVLRFRGGRLIEATPFYHDTSEIISALG